MGLHSKSAACCLALCLALERGSSFAPLRRSAASPCTQRRRAAPLTLRAEDTVSEAELIERLRETEADKAFETALGALAVSAASATVATLSFTPVAKLLRSTVGEAGLQALYNDQGQYFQNYVNAVNILFSLLLVNTLVFLYGQQEALYVALFREVSVAKALLEQIAYISRGRPEYADELLGYVERYVEDDLRALSVPPVVTLSSRKTEPLECVMWLTSVGAPGYVYDTVKTLREARGMRLGALQRKLPPAHFGLLVFLAGLVLLVFPLLGAATGLAVPADDGLLNIQAVLFGLLTVAISLTLAVLYSFWLPTGSAYNVDAVLGVMVQGLELEIKERREVAKKSLQNPRSDGDVMQQSARGAD